MSTDLYQEAERKARKEYLRLTGVSVDVTSEEMLTQWRDKRPDAKAVAQMIVTWEPMSYRKEGGKYGNIETDYIKMTVGDGLTDEEAESVRHAFWRGIPTDKRMSIPKNLSDARRLWERWMIKARQAGLRLEIGEDGNFTSPDVGTVFEVEAGFDTFPQWDANKGKRGGWTDPSKGETASSIYARYPVAKASDYVVPDDVPVRFVSSDDDTGPAVTATAGVSGGVTAAQLAAAFTEAGIAGMKATDLEKAATQVDIINRNGKVAPILFLPEIQAEAQNGTLLAYAETKGAIVIDDDGVIRTV